MVEIEVGLGKHESAPIGQIVVAQFPLPFGAFHNGEDEMQVGVSQFIEFHARGTPAAGVRFAAVGTAQVACIGNGQRHFAHAFGAADEAGVRNTPLFHLLNEASLHFLLSDDVFEKHAFCFLMI